MHGMLVLEINNNITLDENQLPYYCKTNREAV